MDGMSLAVDNGVVSSPVAKGGNALTDSTKNWAVNVHKNRLVRIVSDGGSGQLAVIDNNSSNTLKIRGNWPQGITAGANYVIIDRDLAQELRDVFGGGSDIDVGNPLQTRDSLVNAAVVAALREVLGGGSDLLTYDQERLSSYHWERRNDKKPTDFFYGGTYHHLLDTYWTNDGFTNPEGSWLMAFSKKTWIYPAFAFPCMWPTLGAPGDPHPNLFVQFESGGSSPISRSGFRMYQNTFNLGGGAGTGRIFVRIDNFLPANYDSVEHEYGLKLNRCNIEGYIDGALVGIVLFGLPEAIPTWENNPPYSIGSSASRHIAMRTPFCVLSEPGAPQPSLTFPLPWWNQFVCNDGDPLPPRQYPLYTENTATKWKALATAGVVLTSHPIPVWGFPTKTLVFQADAAGNLDIQVYSGGGWRSWVPGGITLVANQLEVYNLNGEIPIARCVYTPTNADTITLAEWYLS